MAVRLVVNADVRGQQQIDNLNRSVMNIDRNSQRFSRTLGGLQRLVRAAFAVASVAVFAKSVTGASDALTGVRNQLKSAGIAAEDLTGAQQDVLDLANDTRSSYEATGNLYARVLRSSQDLGVSQQEALDITKAFQQSLALSGASTQEAAAASLQFGQALASGRLQGDELRSILENNSFFAQGLAKELGVGVGELRQLGAEGKLTSGLLAEIALKLGPEMNKQFDMLEPTFGQAFEVFQNGVQQALAGVGDILNDTFGIKDSAIEIGRALSDIFGPEGTGFDLSGIGTSLSNAVSNFDATAFSMQLNFEIFQIGRRITESIQGVDWATVFSNVVKFMTDAITVGLNTLFNLTGQGASILTTFFNSAGPALSKAIDDFDPVALVDSVSGAFDMAVNNLAGFVENIDWIAVFGTIAELFVDALVLAYEVIFKVGGAIGKLILSLFQSLSNSFVEFLDTGFVKFFDGLGEAFKRIFNSITEGLFGGINDLFGTEIDIESIKKIFSDAVDAVIEGAKMLFTDLKTLFTGIFTGEISFEDIKTGFFSLVDELKTAFQGIFTGLGEFAKTPINALIGIFEAAINKILLNTPDILLPESLEDGIMIPRLNQGGRIAGAGSGTSDSILARLSDGEFVINAAQTEKFLPLLEAINDNQIPGFQNGGRAGELGARLSSLGFSGFDISGFDDRQLDRLTTQIENLEEAISMNTDSQDTYRGILESTIRQDESSNDPTRDEEFFNAVGEDFKNSLQSSLSDALRSGDFSNVGKTLANTLSNSIIDNFTSGLVDSLFENIDFGSLFTSGTGAGLFSFLGFEEGGVVPGRRGQAVPIVAHAGEVVLNEEQQQALGGMGGVTINLGVTGNVNDETRRNIREMIPQIADSVQATFTERQLFGRAS